MATTCAQSLSGSVAHFSLLLRAGTRAAVENWKWVGAIDAGVPTLPGQPSLRAEARSLLNPNPQTSNRRQHNGGMDSLQRSEQQLFDSLYSFPVDDVNSSWGFDPSGSQSPTAGSQLLSQPLEQQLGGEQSYTETASLDHQPAPVQPEPVAVLPPPRSDPHLPSGKQHSTKAVHKRPPRPPKPLPPGAIMCDRSCAKCRERKGEPAPERG